MAARPGAATIAATVVAATAVIALVGLGGCSVRQRGSVLSRTTAPSGEGATATAPIQGPTAPGISLSDLAGQWEVYRVATEGGRPNMLTLKQRGDLVVGRLSGRNNRLELRAVDGELQGTFFHPIAGEVPVNAKLTEGDTLEVFETGPEGKPELLISAGRGQCASVANEMPQTGWDLTGCEAVDLVTERPDVSTWIAQLEAAPVGAEQPMPWVEVAEEQRDRYTVRALETVQEEEGERVGTYAEYEVDKTSGEVKETVPPTGRARLDEETWELRGAE